MTWNWICHLSPLYILAQIDGSCSQPSSTRLHSPSLLQNQRSAQLHFPDLLDYSHTAHEHADVWKLSITSLGYQFTHFCSGTWALKGAGELFIFSGVNLLKSWSFVECQEYTSVMVLEDFGCLTFGYNSAIVTTNQAFICRGCLFRTLQCKWYTGSGILTV